MPESTMHLLRDYAWELRTALVASSAEHEFARGRRFGIYEALSLLLSQIDAFGIDWLQLGVADLDADALFIDRAD